MAKAFENCIDIPVSRSEKPREVGLNFAGDWGWELSYIDGMLEAVGDYLDVVKLAVLTGRLTDRDFIKRKVKLYNDNQVKVFPGGMTLEAALICKKVEAFFDEAKDLGCSVVEVSESEVHMTPDTRHKLTEMGKERGFQVLVELGPHHPDEPFAPGHIIKECNEALQAGAWKIVLEGEVILMMKPWQDQAGAEKIFRIVDAVGRDNLIFEIGGNLKLAQWFILKYGPDVSFGNVGRDKVMPIEHIRRGLNYPDTWFGKFAAL
ncbi:MAG: hypothetical protein GXP25_24845 [Planctomycetes bacterium]|nr:hypothetical protein [Planctomycetota bacterium]